MNGVYVYRQPSLLVGVFLFTIGFNLILLGLLAELIVRTYHESQSKPVYLVRERRNFEEQRAAPVAAGCACAESAAIVGHGPVDREVLARMTATSARTAAPTTRASTRASTTTGRRRPRLPPALDHRPRDRQSADRPTRTARVQVVFNGEIYNFRELRAELEAPRPSLRDERRHRGHRAPLRGARRALRRAPERHVRLRALGRRRDASCCSRATGSARSRSTTPSSASRLLFGSELKALLEHPRCPRELDLESLSRYLALEYVPTPHSIFEGVRKLPGGHFLRWRDGRASIERYWDLDVRRATPTPIATTTTSRSSAQLLREAVRRRLVSDVPLGAFLSGGIDSSSVVAMMAEALPPGP